uniref:Uncharacterized protein n=1 Tax=Knipowitschia caucasica TaxID=637954 RepID=A0AAV2KQW5_KNICA
MLDMPPIWTLANTCPNKWYENPPRNQFNGRRRNQPQFSGPYNGQQQMWTPNDMPQPPPPPEQNMTQRTANITQTLRQPHITYASGNINMAMHMINDSESNSTDHICEELAKTELYVDRAGVKYWYHLEHCIRSPSDQTERTLAEVQDDVARNTTSTDDRSTETPDALSGDPGELEKRGNLLDIC